MPRSKMPPRQPPTQHRGLALLEAALEHFDERVCSRTECQSIGHEIEHAVLFFEGPMRAVVLCAARALSTGEGTAATSLRYLVARAKRSSALLTAPRH